MYLVLANFQPIRYRNFHLDQFLTNPEVMAYELNPSGHIFNQSWNSILVPTNFPPIRRNQFAPISTQTEVTVHHTANQIACSSSGWIISDWLEICPDEFNFAPIRRDLFVPISTQTIVTVHHTTNQISCNSCNSPRWNYL